jgi:hypothetical protein
MSPAIVSTEKIVLSVASWAIALVVSEKLESAG